MTAPKKSQSKRAVAKKALHTKKAPAKKTDRTWWCNDHAWQLQIAGQTVFQAVIEYDAPTQGNLKSLIISSDPHMQLNLTETIKLNDWLDEKLRNGSPG